MIRYLEKSLKNVYNNSTTVKEITFWGEGGGGGKSINQVLCTDVQINHQK